MVKRIPGARHLRASILVAASAGLLATHPAQAGINSPNLVFPPADSTLQMPAGTSVSFPGLSYSIDGLSFSPPSSGVPLSTSTDTFEDLWPNDGDVDFTSNGKAGEETIQVTNPDITFGPDQNPGGLAFTFKLVAVKTISWAHDDESPKETRISPTNPSTGELDYTLLPDGTYDISCDMDLNLQVSMDSGQTWTDGSSPLHLDLVSLPEPSSMVLLGALPVALQRRRRQNTA